MNKNKQIKEDGVGLVGGVPTNNAGAGEIDGIGVGSKGEPGVKTKKKLASFISFMRRPKPPQV